MVIVLGGNRPSVYKLAIDLDEDCRLWDQLLDGLWQVMSEAKKEWCAPLQLDIFMHESHFWMEFENPYQDSLAATFNKKRLWCAFFQTLTSAWLERQLMEFIPFYSGLRFLATFLSFFNMPTALFKYADSDLGQLKTVFISDFQRLQLCILIFCDLVFWCLVCKVAKSGKQGPMGNTWSETIRIDRHSFSVMSILAMDSF